MKHLVIIAGLLFASMAMATDMSGWSDKTVCRLLEQQGKAAYIDEAKSRGLACAVGTIQPASNVNKTKKQKLVKGKMTVLSLASYPDAICNSGAPASYAIQMSNQDSNKWAILLRGGGAAYKPADMKNRQSDLKQSLLHDIGAKTFEPLEAFKSLLKYQYNVVYLPNCSSDMYIGDHYHQIDGKKVPFKGRKIVEALVSEIGEQMNENSDLIVGGWSAGANGTAFNLDLFKTLPAKSIKLVFDGYWLDKPELNYRKNNPQWLNQNIKAFTFKTLPKNCVNQHVVNCFPSLEYINANGIAEAFVVWNRGEMYRRNKNNAEFEASMKQELNNVGGGISVSEGYGSGGNFNQHGGHVVLFGSIYNKKKYGLKPKNVFESWLQGGEDSIYVDYSK